MLDHSAKHDDPSLDKASHKDRGAGPPVMSQAAGAGGNKITISDNMLRFVYGIGATETDFSKREAYSEAYNQEGNNANVRSGMQKHHMSLADAKANYGDYGFYQNNHQDEIKSGVDGMLYGSLAGQTDAVGHYITKMFPKAAALIEAGNFAAAIPMLNHHWFGLKDRPEKALAYAAQPIDKIKKLILGGPTVTQGAGGGGGSSGHRDPSVDDVVKGKAVVHVGMSGDAVKRIQSAVGANPDGHFGPATALAVKAYQKSHGLAKTGRVDQTTMKVIMRDAGH